MPLYLVERHLPGFTDDQLAVAAGRAKSTTAEMTKEGLPVRYHRSTFVPGEDKCFCLFEGPSSDAVRLANERADLPFQRIIEAKHISSDDLT